MADYTELRGLKVKYLSSDPSPGTKGDVWYNTAGQLKAYVGRPAWSAGTPLSTGRNLLGRAGTQTTGLAISGYHVPSSPEVTANVEAYDGTGWAETGNVNTARYGMQGDGTQTAAIIAGGINPGGSEFRDETETWD